ncbi:hypothetical protein F9K98_13280 [Brucella anthropi]|uniref:hypothetical protein n=1 Tax=Brucella anthropi TaxID=529 RepID=UPI00124D2A71|nr:hypothetical protein [Brucella anthropi]KAB2762761.1 hypothetical protein F9K98_13280 [Brucella anthropi]
MKNIISRRSLLQALPAVSVAVAVPSVALAAAPEHPRVKARRLARELSYTLAEIEPEDRPSLAMVWADDRRGYRISFVNE